jgi:hypothetical protein
MTDRNDPVELKDVLIPDPELARLRRDLQKLADLWREYAINDQGDAQQIYLYGGMAPQTAADQIEHVLNSRLPEEHLRDQHRRRK